MAKPAQLWWLLIINLAGLMSLFLVTDIKSYILVFLLYLGALFLLSSLSLTEVFFAGFLLSLPFEKGLRDYMFVVVPPGPEEWMTGYSFYWGLSLKVIFGVTTLLLLLTEFKKSSQFSWSKTTKLLSGPLILFFMMAGVSTWLASDFNLAMVGLLRVLFLVVMFYVAVVMLRRPAMRQVFKYVVIAWSLFLGVVGTWQFFNHQPLGLFIEETGYIRSFGYSTSDGELQYRVSGTTGHPTFFGSLLAMIIPYLLGVLLSGEEWKVPVFGMPKAMSLFLQKNAKYLLYAGIFLSLFALIVTLSRSAWLSLVLMGGLFSLNLGWRQKFNYQKLLPELQKLIVGGVVVLVILSSMIVPRLGTFFNLFGLSSGKVRVTLLQQALVMTSQNPWFGVGLNHFTRVMNFNPIDPNLRGFMYPVHNTWALFMAEIGIIGGVAIISFFVGGVIMTLPKVRHDWILFGAWVAVVIFGLNSQAHTLFSQDASLEVACLFLAYILSS